MAFEWKNYPKYDMTLGEYYARKQSIIVPRDDSGTPLDSITFTDVEGNEVSYSTKEIENVALNRHGNKRMLYMPDWFANNYNNNDSPKFPYSGSSKTDYVELYNLYYSDQLFPSWWNKSTQENFNRIFQALVAKYSPIENTDKYAEWTDAHTGKDTNTKTGNDTFARTGFNEDVHTGTDSLSKSGSDILTDKGSTVLSKAGTETNTKGGSDVLARTGSDVLTDKGTEELNKAGSETTTKGGTDSIAYGATNTETKNLVDTTTYNGSEVNTAGGTDTVGIDKTTTTTHNTTDTTNIAGTETDTLVKSGSILENNDTDVYEYPYNGSTKQATSHTDNRTNTRYGKYKDADGTPTTDEYNETNTKNYTGRYDTTTHNGDDTVTEQGTDTNTYGKTDTKTFTDRNDSLTQTGTDVNAKSGTDTTTYDTTDTLTYAGRSDTNNVDMTHTTQFGGTDTTTYDTTDTLSYKDRADTNNVDMTHTTQFGGVDTNTYDSNLKTNFNSTDTTTYNTTDTDSYGSEMKHIEHTHGNIGVTTNQAMIKEEISLRLGKSFLNMLVDDLAAYICME